MTFAPASRATTPSQLALALKLAKAVGVRVPQEAVTDGTAASEFITAAAAACGHAGAELQRVRDAMKDRGLAPPEDANAAAWTKWLRGIQHVREPDAFTETLRYWRHMVEGLHFDAAAGLRSIAEIPVDAFAGIVDSASEVLPASTEGTEQLWALLGAPAPDGRRIEVMAIPLQARERAIVPARKLPYFNPAAFLPASEGNLVPMPVLGDRAAIDRALLSARFDPAESATAWWNRLRALLQDALGGDVLDGAPTATGAQLYREARIVEATMPHAVRAVARVYEDVSCAAEAAGALRTLVEGTGPVRLSVDEQDVRFADRVTGLMERVGADAAPMDRYQRLAAGASLALGPDEIQAINGPPGTGKTRTLRAVLASSWVNAAAAGAKVPPLLLASGPTNKAVTNIIAAFDGIATPGLLAPEGDPSARWLPGDLPYGWYVPSGRKRAQSMGYAILAKDPGSGKLRPDGVAAAIVEWATEEARMKWMIQFGAWANMDPLTTSLPVACATLRAALQSNLKAQRGAQKLFEAACAGGPRIVTRAMVDHADAEAGVAEHLARVASGTDTACREEKELLLQTITRACEVIHRMEASLPWWARLATNGFKAAYLEKRNARLQARYAIEQESALAKLALPAHVSPATVAKLIERRVAEREPVWSMAEAALADKAARRDETSRAAATLTALWQASGSRDGTGDAEADAYVLELSFHVASGAKSKADGWCALQGWLDTQYRIPAFHLAARYWEGWWLDAAEAPSGRLDALRYWSALAPVIVATFHTLPRAVGGALSGADLLVVDEAGQASPDMGAAAVALAKRAVVVGDTAQLEPVSTVSADEEANAFARNGVRIPASHRLAGGSLMQMAQAATAFADGGAQPGITLRRHYRSRPRIIGFCNELAYGGELEIARGDADAWLPPLVVHAVPTSTPVENVSGSVRQVDEAAAAIAWIEAHRCDIEERCGSLAAGVALIAPFRAQAEALRRAAAAAWGDDVAGEMVVGTVHALQGAERPVVVFSLTQADPHSLFVDRVGASLLNVAVSRAKESFVLVCADRLLAGAGEIGRRSPSAMLLHYAASKPE